MNDELSIGEIEAKFESEWVLIEDPLTDEALEVHGGTVRWHGKDRDEVYRRAVEMRPKRFAIVYTKARCLKALKSYCEFWFRYPETT